MAEPKKLIIVGGGEHARVVIDIARSRPDLWLLAGFADPEPQPETASRCGLHQLMSDFEALDRAGESHFVLGMGQTDSSAARRRLADLYGLAGGRWATVVHASAWISSDASLDEGAVVCAGAMINTGATVGRHAVINTGAIIEHDVRVGEFAMVGPGAAIGGGTLIGAGTFIGLGCSVRDHVSIGGGTIVGMGSVVVKSLPENVRAMGVPARAE